MMKSSFAYRNGVLCAEAVPLVEIAQEMDSSFLCASRSQLAQNIRNMRAFMQPTGPLVLCSEIEQDMSLAAHDVLAHQGAGVVVTSAGALERALEAGYLPSAMILAGQGKSQDDIAAALLAGTSMITAGSFAELALVADVAAALGKRAPVGLVLTLEESAVSALQYGFAIDDIAAVFSFIHTMPDLFCAGFSVALGGGRARIEKMLYNLARIVHVLEGQGVASPSFLFGIGAFDLKTSGPMIGLVAQLLGGRVFVRSDAALVSGAYALVSRVVRIDETRSGKVVVLDMLAKTHALCAQDPLCTDVMPLESGAAPVSGEPMLFMDREGKALCSGLMPSCLARGQAVALTGFNPSNGGDRLSLPEVMVDGARCVVTRRRIAVAEQTQWETLPETKVIERAA